MIHNSIVVAPINSKQPPFASPLNFASGHMITPLLEIKNVAGTFDHKKYP